MTDTSEHYKRVVEFHRLAEALVGDKPAVPSPEECILRAKLILEEALETVEALGVTVSISSGGTLYTFQQDIEMSRLMFEADMEPDLVGIADGCADVMVVTSGTLIACGIADKALLEVVDENNLEKFGPGGHRREDGKWIKPPDHPKPDIESVLKAQGWEG